jgi:hypothetical protein
VKPGDVFSNAGWVPGSWAACLGAYAHEVMLAGLNSDGGTMIRSYAELQKEGWMKSSDAGATWQRAEKPEGL